MSQVVVRDSRIYAIGRYLCLVFFVVAMAITAGAQSASETTTRMTSKMTPRGMSPGAPAGSYALSNFDNINLFNGTLSTRIPLLQIGGRGTAGYTMMLATDNKKWQVRHERPGAPPDDNRELRPTSDVGAEGTSPLSVNTHTFTPEWQRWNTLNVGYGAGVMQGRQTGSGTLKRSACDTCPVTCPRLQPMWAYTLTRLTFIGPDGTEYELRDKTTNGKPMLVEEARCFDTSNNGAVRGRVFVSTDGSNITFISQNVIRDRVDVHRQRGHHIFNATGLLYLPDGTRYEIVDGIVRAIQDRNGNRVTLNYGCCGADLVIRDSLNRTVSVHYNLTEEPYGLHDRIVMKGYGGAERVTRVSRTSLGLALRDDQGGEAAYYTALFPELNGASNIIEPGSNQPARFDPSNQVSRVWLPDGRSYRIFYNKYGEVARVELPTGGVFEYDMTPGSGVLTSPGATPATEEVEKYIYRRIKERRTYKETTAPRSGWESKTTYTAGDGSTYSDVPVVVEQYGRGDNLLARSRHGFNGSALQSLFSADPGTLYSPALEGKELGVETLDLTQAQTVLRSSTNHWAQREAVAWVGQLESRNLDVPPPGLAVHPDNDPRLIKTVARLDNDLVSQQEFGYDQFNNQTDVKEYAYGSGTPGSLIRHTRTEYLNNGLTNGLNYTEADYVDGAGQRQPYPSDQVAHLRNLPWQKIVCQGVCNEGTTRSRIDFEYDNYIPGNNENAALGARPDISGIDDTSYLIVGAGMRRARGNLTRITLVPTDGSEWVNTFIHYDVAGNVVGVRDPRGFSTTFGYDDRFGPPDGNVHDNYSSPELAAAGKQSYAFPTSATNALNQTSFAQYDYYLGRVVDGQDNNGVVSSASYNDILDRPNQIIVGVNTESQFHTDLRNQTTFNYGYGDSAANRFIETTSDLRGYGDNLIKSRILYDGLGRTIETRRYEDEAAPEHYIASVQEYDGLGRVKLASNPYRPWRNETAVYTETQYDALGRVVTTITHTESAAAANAKVVTAYRGNLVMVTDQAGKARRSKVDALGRLTEVIEFTRAVSDPTAVAEPAETDYRTDYEYDVLGNLRQVRQGAQVRNFVYDSLSRLTSSTNPEQEGITIYSYDANGNLEVKTDARGVVTTNQYDELNRVRSVSFNVGGTAVAVTPRVAYGYDDPSVPFSKGKVTSVSNGVSTTRFDSYDALGRVTASTQVTEGQSYQMSYRYDLAGGLISETYPSGRTVSTTVDVLGRVSAVSQGMGAQQQFYASEFDYAAHGGVKQLKLGNGLYETTIFNNRLQPEVMKLGTTQNGSDKWQIGYGYGAASQNNGNIHSQTITAPGPTATQSLAMTQSYTYDAVNRLETAREVNNLTPCRNAQGAETDCWKQVYKYDRYGNRTFEVGTTLPDLLSTDPRVINPEIDPLTNRFKENRINDAHLYRYDTAGNLVRNTAGQTFAYDAENRQVSYNGGARPETNGTEYAYDGNGRRVKKVTNASTTVFVYDALGRLVAEYDSASQSGGVMERSYVTADVLGSTRVVTDRSGGVRARHDYLPFGEELFVGRADAMGYKFDNIRQKFTGYERDNETGLDFAQARYFASTQGRFTSIDPYNPIVDSEKQEDFNEYLGQPQNWNRYAYVWNNPLRYIDPLGEKVYVVTYTTGNWRDNGGDDELRRAAETKAQHIRDMKGFDPKKDTVLVRGVETKEDFNNTLKEANGLQKQFGKVEQVTLYSHSGKDGPIFHDRSTGRQTQYSQSELSGLRVNWSGSAIAKFYGCNTGVNFAQNFANAQGVSTYGYAGYAYFSNRHDKMVPDKGVGNPLYLIQADYGRASGAGGAARYSLGLGKVYPMVRRDPPPRDRPRR